MKKSLTIIAALVLAVLSGCNDNNDSSKSPPAVDNTPSTTTSTPTPVHNIQPTDVPAYVEKFKRQRKQVMVELDGTRHELTFVDDDEAENTILATYPGALLVIGFDFANEKPLPKLSIFEGDIALLSTNSDKFFTSVTRTLVGTALTLGEENDNAIYTGRVRDQSTQGEFNVRLIYNESLLTGGNSKLTVQADKAMLSGDLGTGTYVQIQDMITNQPQVTELVLQKISGSINDDINVHTGRLVRNAGLNTHILADGDVNSGGVDLFAAGVVRTVDEGATVGVHSWCCEDGITADKLPRDHKAHGTQLTYFREMLGDSGEDFYFFTLNASPFDSVHPMTRAELLQYKLVTQ